MHRQIYEHNPLIGYCLVPSVRARLEHEGGSFLLRANQTGFRCDHEFTAKKKPDTFRVLLFGDSFAAGEGVSNGRRYSEILERLIPGLEVYNFALTGTGTDQQYLIFREFAADLEYDLVLISIWVENIRRNPAHYRVWSSHIAGQRFATGSAAAEEIVVPKPYFVLEPDGSLRLEGVPVARPFAASELPASEREHIISQLPRARLRRLVKLLRLEKLARRSRLYQPYPEYDRPDDPGWILMKAILLRWVSDASSPVIIHPIAPHHYVEGWASSVAFQTRFAELHDPPQVIVHDHLADLRRYSLDERRTFRFEQDRHLTASGHEVHARSLMKPIQLAMEGAR